MINDLCFQLRLNVDSSSDITIMVCNPRKIVSINKCITIFVTYRCHIYCFASVIYNKSNIKLLFAFNDGLIRITFFFFGNVREVKTSKTAYSAKILNITFLEEESQKAVFLSTPNILKTILVW